MKKSVALLASLILAYATTAAAQTGTYKPLPSTAPTTAQPVEERSVVEQSFDSIKTPPWGKPGPYISGQIGAYGPADDQYETEYQPDDGVAANLIFGYRVNTFVSVQGEFGYYDTNGLAEFQFNSMPLMGAIRLGVPLWNFDIYVTGGIGAVFYKAEDYSFNKDAVAVATQLGAGVNYYLTKHFFAGFEGRYMMTDINDAPNDGLMLLGQIGYKF